MLTDIIPAGMRNGAATITVIGVQLVSGGPLPILAPASPKDCFDTAIEAFRIAVRHMTPVLVLSEGFLASSSEPWRIPAFRDLEPIAVQHPLEPDGFQPYSRESGTLARQPSVISSVSHGCSAPSVNRLLIARQPRSLA